jgi:hypothetical protein
MDGDLYQDPGRNNINSSLFYLLDGINPSEGNDDPDVDEEGDGGEGNNNSEPGESGESGESIVGKE